MSSYTRRSRLRSISLSLRRHRSALTHTSRAFRNGLAELPPVPDSRAVRRTLRRDDSTVKSVETYFSSYGFRIGALSAGRDILDVTGTTSEIARAFDASGRDGPPQQRSPRRALHERRHTSSVARPRRHGSSRDSIGRYPVRRTLSRCHSSAQAVTCPCLPDAVVRTGTTPKSLGGYTAHSKPSSMASQERGPTAIPAPDRRSACTNSPTTTRATSRPTSRATD